MQQDAWPAAQRAGDEAAQAEEQQGQRAPGGWRPRWQLPAVPWGLDTTITLMVFWLLCFWFAAYTVVPALLRMAGVQAGGSAAAAAWTQALRHLVLDSLQVRSERVYVELAMAQQLSSSRKWHGCIHQLQHAPKEAAP